MYNRYQGNSGKVERVKENHHSTAKPEKQPQKSPSGPPPLKKLPPQGFSLSSLLPKAKPELETEDIILLLMLYLMYRKSGDTDLLIMMGAMFLL